MGSHAAGLINLILQACVERRLDSVEVKTRPGYSVAVVLASQGYPGSYEKGKKVEVGQVPESENISCCTHVTTDNSLLIRCGCLPRWNELVRR